MEGNIRPVGAHLLELLDQTRQEAWEFFVSLSSKDPLCAPAMELFVTLNAEHSRMRALLEKEG